jgi:hypothetical protein
MLFGNKDLANNAPKNMFYPVNVGGNTAHIANGSQLWQNTTPSAFTNGMVVGLYGVSNTQVQVAQTSYSTNLSQPGWTLVRTGTGPVASANVTVIGASYSNTDTFTVSGNGCVNAVANVTTYANGSITSLKFTNYGFGFPNTAYVTKTFANSTGGTSSGSGATIVLTLGGRAGRVQREVLVAMPTQNSASNTAAFPNHS